MPSKCKSGGKKRHQNSKVTAKSATTQISEKKVMVAESAIKMENGGKKRRQNSKVTAKSATISVIMVEY